MKEVFRNPFYIFLSFAVFLLTLIFSIWLPNISFIRHTAVSQNLSFNQKLGILEASLYAIETNFTPVTRIMTIIISALFSINVSLAVYYFRKRVFLEKVSGVSFIGLIIGFLGIGCASCSSVILASIFGLSAATAFISFLPFRGVEFGLISIAILSYSIYLLLKKITSPIYCKKRLIL